MKLRNLKDLKPFQTIKGKVLLNSFEDCKWAIKQEAIKWVKKIDNPLTDKEVALKLDLYSKCKTQEEVQNCLFGARRLLIVQNNLTEEDLKEKEDET